MTPSDKKYPWAKPTSYDWQRTYSINKSKSKSVNPTDLKLDSFIVRLIDESSVLQRSETEFEHCIVFRNWSLIKLQINIHVSAFCLWDSTRHFISERITISLHAHKWNAICELRQPLWLLEKSISPELSQDEWNYILFLLLCVVEHDSLSSARFDSTVCCITNGSHHFQNHFHSRWKCAFPLRLLTLISTGRVHKILIALLS